MTKWHSWRGFMVAMAAGGVAYLLLQFGSEGDNGRRLTTLLYRHIRARIGGQQTRTGTVACTGSKRRDRQRRLLLPRQIRRTHNGKRKSNAAGIVGNKRGDKPNGKRARIGCNIAREEVDKHGGASEDCSHKGRGPATTSRFEALWQDFDTFKAGYGATLMNAQNVLRRKEAVGRNRRNTRQSENGAGCRIRRATTAGTASPDSTTHACSDNDTGLTQWTTHGCGRTAWRMLAG